MMRGGALVRTSRPRIRGLKTGARRFDPMAVEALSHEGMPTHAGDLSIEVHGIEPIPPEARYGSLGRIFTVWFTPNLVPAAFFIGTLAAADFLKIGFVTGILAILVGNIVGSVLVGILGTMGPSTGMAQMPLARLAYGKSIVIPGMLNWLSCIGWDGINSIFGASALTLLTGMNFVVSLVIIVVLQAALGVIGYEAIHTFEKYMAFALGAMFVVLTISIFGQASTGRTDGFTGLDQLGAFVLFSTICASFVLAWALYASDYSRYLPVNTSKFGIFWITVVALTLSAGWIEVLGLAVADKVTAESVGTIHTILGGGPIGGLAMIAIALGTVAVNALNDYTGSLSLLAAGIRVPRVASAFVVAVLGFLFTLYLNSGDFAGKFTNYLLFLSYWIAPWAAVVLVDWWLRRGRADTARLVQFSALPSGLLGLVSLVIGFLASLPFQQSSYGEELHKTYGLPINVISDTYLHYADFAYVIGFVLAALVYWIGWRMMQASSPEPI
jgi:nucleobase:cation symporter-1, NCS1 family